MNAIIKKIKKYLQSNDLEQYLKKKYFDYGLVAFSFLLGFYLRWEMQNILFFSFVIWIILNPQSSRFLASVTLYFLAFTPLLIIIKREDHAEKFAIYAYYFLALTVIFAIIEHKRIKKST